MRKIMSLVLSFACFICTLINSCEVVRANEQISKREVVNELIEQYAKDEDANYTIREMYDMKGISDEKKIYTFFELNPYGYIIIYNDTNALMEACFSDVDYKLEIGDDKEIFYGGPGYCLINENEKYKSFITGTEISKAELNCAKQRDSLMRTAQEKAEKINANSKNNTRASSYYEVNTTYFKNLNEHGRNVNGTCTVLAMCMLLGYYDEYRSDAYIIDSYRDGSGTNEAFHQYMNYRVYGNGEQGGIFIRDALSGFNSYFAERGGIARAYSVYSTQQAAVQKVVEYISRGNPVIASMATTYGADYNHTVVVYGVYNTFSSAWENYVFRMHMGWSDSSYNSYYASAAWFYECGYIA